MIEFEKEISKLFLDKKIRFPIHLSGGNEDILEEIFKEVKEGDWVFSTHRNHYHALLSGFDPDELKEWIVNKGSMHIYKERFFTSGIVGGIVPIALGVAMAGERVWCFVGDMAATTGIFHECFLYAMGHDLPITFIIEDNGFSVDTPTNEVWGKGTKVDLRRYEYERIYPHQGCGVHVLF